LDINVRDRASQAMRAGAIFRRLGTWAAVHHHPALLAERIVIVLGVQCQQRPAREDG